MQLTEEQQFILQNYDTNCFLNAGPGSGKSTILSIICNKILENYNNQVMLITFTNSASKSIAGKCSNSDQKRIISGTFHGIAYKLMSLNGITKYICDENKKNLIIKKIFGCKSNNEDFEIITSIISNLKSKYPLDINNEYISRYQEELDKYNLVDFDDILFNFINLVNDNKCGLPKLTHLLVDELQDTSEPQFEMIKSIHAKTNCKIIGCGDLDQCIYMFRNAKFENTTDFISYFNCKTFDMGYNFRSDQIIVEKASNLIVNNKNRLPKIIKSASTNKGFISSYECDNPFNEIDYIIMKCKQLYNKNITILYRNRSYKCHLEFELRKAKLKYEINDSFEITDRSAVKSILSILKICTKEFDIYDLQNAARAIQGLGPTTVNKLEALVTETTPINVVFEQQRIHKKTANRVKHLVELQDYYNNHKNSNLELLVREIENHFNKSFDYTKEMRDFILDISRDYSMNNDSIKTLYNELGLNAKEEHKDEDARIQLSTIHSFKGAEDDVIIMPWCQLYEQQPGKKYEIEEERRLFYVGVTRARSTLYMTYSGDVPRFIKELKL